MTVFSPFFMPFLQEEKDSIFSILQDLRESCLLHASKRPAYKAGQREKDVEVCLVKRGGLYQQDLFFFFHHHGTCSCSF